MFGQPRLDVNAGIGSGTSALAVAAMVGNEWAIARYIKKYNNSTQKKGNQFSPQALFWKRVGGGKPSKFKWQHSTSLGCQDGLPAVHQGPAEDAHHRCECLQQGGQDRTDVGR